MSPFVGTWKANLSRSHRHPKHQFQSATLRAEVSGDTVTLTQEGVNHDGKVESGTTVLHADGVERPVSPQAPGFVMIARWMGTHVLETEARKDGQSVGRGSYVVSDDGKTLTARVSSTDASGEEVAQVIVFDRV